MSMRTGEGDGCGRLRVARAGSRWCRGESMSTKFGGWSKRRRVDGDVVQLGGRPNSEEGRGREASWCAPHWDGDLGSREKSEGNDFDGGGDVRGWGC